MRKIDYIIFYWLFYIISSKKIDKYPLYELRINISKVFNEFPDDEIPIYTFLHSLQRIFIFCSRSYYLCYDDFSDFIKEVNKTLHY